MSKYLCAIFGHKWQKGWAGAFSGYFGAIVVNYRDCERCGARERELTTEIDIKAPS